MWVKMEENLMIVLSVFLSVIGAVIFRVELFYRKSCLQIGREIVTAEILEINNSGHQDAITNPKRNKIFLLGLILIGASPFTPFGTGDDAFYWSLLISLFSMILAGLLLSKKLSKQHYLPIIYADLVKRKVEFNNSGDIIRGKAAEDISNLILQKYEFLKILTPENKK